MKEAILILAGFTGGGIMGVVIMCMFQINTINRYERRIKKLKKALANSENIQKNSD